MSTDNSAVYLVVGGSGGIGADVARQLAAKGARVIVTGRDAGRLAAIGSETGSTTLELEARDSAAVDAALQQVHASHGRLDGVVNCAGSILLKPAHLITDEEFAETLALAAASYARYQVRVNCVAPGLTRTGLTRTLTQNEAVARASAVLHPLARIGEPAEVAAAICWLLDGAQAWITGQVIGVDGGLGGVQARA